MDYDKVTIGMNVKIIAGVGAGQLTGRVIGKRKSFRNRGDEISGPGVVVRYAEEFGAVIVKSPAAIEPLN